MDIFMNIKISPDLGKSGIMLCDLIPPGLSEQYNKTT